MSTDLLKAQANERVDLVDFDFLANECLQDIVNEPNSGFLTNPLGQRAWIIDGFGIDCPAGKQLRVTRGRAILSTRQAGQVKYGYVTTLGDASKIVDLASYSPGTYNVYIRFEYVDGDSSSRVFWNPAGGGGEFATTVSTRIKANWSIRVEAASPGGEWLKIGEVDQATLASPTTGITDKRPLYFEGSVHNSYQSGWSSDGGGGANDRNADRQAYGVKDLQAFTAAMRQCMEDIKGRGLRRWWDRDIGGLNVGFDADPVEDRIALADADFNLKWVDPYCYLNFDETDGDYFRYQRDISEFAWAVGGSFEAKLKTSGLCVANGLIVGNVTGTPTDNEIYAEGDIQSGSGRFKHDADDYFDITNGGPQDWVIGGNTEMRLSANGLAVHNGIYVGNYTGAPTDNDIYAEGSIECGTTIDAGGDATFGTITMTGFSVDADGDMIAKSLSCGAGAIDCGSLDVSGGGITNAGSIGGAVNISATGWLTGASLNLGSGTGQLDCGFINSTGDIRTTQGLRIGSGSTNPAAGMGIFSGGLAVGYDAAPAADEVRIGDATFSLKFNGGNPRIEGESGLHLQFNRAADTIDLLAGGSTWTFDADKITIPDSSYKTSSLLTSYLCRRNSVRTLVRCSSSGTIRTTSDFGVESVTSPGTGQYDIDATGIGKDDYSVSGCSCQATTTNLQRGCWCTDVNIGTFDAGFRVTIWSYSLSNNVNQEFAFWHIGAS